MQQNISKKLVWGDKLREYKIILPIGAAVFTLVSCMLFKAAITAAEKDRAVNFVMAIAFTIGEVGVLIYGKVHGIPFLSTEYACAENCVRMWNEKFECAVNLTAPFYLCRVVISGGKGFVKRFLLFSPVPIERTLDPDDAGEIWKDIIATKSVIIPQNDEEIHQILAGKGIHEIPEFPKSICCPGKG